MRFAHCACHSNLPKLAEEMVQGTVFRWRLNDERILHGPIEHMVIEPKESPMWMGSSATYHQHFVARLTVCGVEFRTDEIHSVSDKQPTYAEGSP